MKDYTNNTHVKNYYENGRADPRVLIESPSGENDYIEYSSTLLTSSIVQYEGNIPDAEDIKLNVWHYSNSVQDPKQVVVGEYDTIQCLQPTNTDDKSLEERVAEWAGDEFDPRSYDKHKRAFLLNTKDEREPYCTTLTTCSCGDRKVCNSVSEAVGLKSEHQSSECSEYSIWYFCGVIDRDTRRMSKSAYEANIAGISEFINKIGLGTGSAEPLYKVPIDETPYSIALKDVGGYDTTDHVVGDPVSKDED